MKYSLEQWSCIDKYTFFSVQVYSNLEGNRSHVVNTGWALMSLIDAGQVTLFGLPTCIVIF